MNNIWRTRERRATFLTETQQHAAELLTFYRRILHAQETVYSNAREHNPLPETFDRNATPRCDLTRLPVDQLAGPFATFIDSLRDAAPEVTAAIGVSLLTAGPVSALHWFVTKSAQRPSGCAEFNPVQLAFYPRAFLQPLLGHALDDMQVSTVPANTPTCPICGALPQLALLKDEADVKGQRRLVCSLCSTAWRFPRVMCPSCKETSSAKLYRHENEATPHVTVDECTSCHHYLKTIDLRKDGRAEPYVEDIATVELDLWAGERALTKIQPNLLGF